MFYVHFRKFSSGTLRREPKAFRGAAELDRCTARISHWKPEDLGDAPAHSGRHARRIPIVASARLSSELTGIATAATSGFTSPASANDTVTPL